MQKEGVIKELELINLCYSRLYKRDHIWIIVTNDKESNICISNSLKNLIIETSTINYAFKYKDVLLKRLYELIVNKDYFYENQSYNSYKTYGSYNSYNSYKTYNTYKTNKSYNTYNIYKNNNNYYKKKYRTFNSCNDLKNSFHSEKVVVTKLNSIDDKSQNKDKNSYNNTNNDISTMNSYNSGKINNNTNNYDGVNIKNKPKFYNQNNFYKKKENTNIENEYYEKEIEINYSNIKYNPTISIKYSYHDLQNYLIQLDGKNYFKKKPNFPDREECEGVIQEIPKKINQIDLLINKFECDECNDTNNELIKNNKNYSYSRTKDKKFNKFDHIFSDDNSKIDNCKVAFTYDSIKSHFPSSANFPNSNEFGFPVGPGFMFFTNDFNDDNEGYNKNNEDNSSSKSEGNNNKCNDSMDNKSLSHSIIDNIDNLINDNFF